MYMFMNKSESYSGLRAIADAPTLTQDGTLSNTVLIETNVNAHLMKMRFTWN